MAIREWGLVEVCRQSGLSKHQVRYLEVLTLLGQVRRTSSNDRRYSDEQLTFLKKVGLLRQSGIGIQEAAAIAAEGSPGVPPMSDARLRRIADRVLEESTPRLRAALLLLEIMSDRVQPRPREPERRAS